MFPNGKSDICAFPSHCGSYFGMSSCFVTFHGSAHIACAHPVNLDSQMLYTAHFASICCVAMQVSQFPCLVSSHCECTISFFNILITFNTNIHILFFIFILFLGFIPMLSKDSLYVFFSLESLNKNKEVKLSALLQVEIAVDPASYRVCVYVFHIAHCLHFLPSL